MQESTDESEKEPDIKMLSIEIQKSFRKILKCGIYKELHRRSLLSDEQLNSLITVSYTHLTLPTNSRV